MRKYWVVFTTTVKEYFVYRLNFIIWRLRVFLSFAITFFLWLAVFQDRIRFASYEKNYLLSYILYANILANFVLGTRTIDIAAEIIDGSIINRLLKPISFFKFYLCRDLADKLLNLVFVVVEVGLLVILFKTPLVTPKNWLVFFVFISSGTLISFFISLCLSFFGFWSNEVWSPRFLFLTMVFFLSGTYFPLDLLPRIIYYLLLLTPFPYLYYLPTQILLGKVYQIGYWPLIISFFWLWLLGRITVYLWRTGNKNYSFWGR